MALSTWISQTERPRIAVIKLISETMKITRHDNIFKLLKKKWYSVDTTRVCELPIGKMVQGSFVNRQ